MMKKLVIVFAIMSSMILVQFSAAPAMAKTAFNGMTHDVTMMDNHMGDCPSMAAESSEDDICNENAAKGCCKDHASCSTTALALVGQISNLRLNPNRQMMPPLSANLLSIALNHSTPPPKS